MSDVALSHQLASLSLKHRTQRKGNKGRGRPCKTGPYAFIPGSNAGSAGVHQVAPFVETLMNAASAGYLICPAGFKHISEKQEGYFENFWSQASGIKNSVSIKLSPVERFAVVQTTYKKNMIQASQPLYEKHEYGAYLVSSMSQVLNAMQLQSGGVYEHFKSTHDDLAKVSHADAASREHIKQIRECYDKYLLIKDVEGVQMLSNIMSVLPPGCQESFNKNHFEEVDEIVKSFQDLSQNKNSASFAFSMDGIGYDMQLTREGEEVRSEFNRKWLSISSEEEAKMTAYEYYEKCYVGLVAIYPPEKDVFKVAYKKGTEYVSKLGVLYRDLADVVGSANVTQVLNTLKETISTTIESLQVAIELSNFHPRVAFLFEMITNGNLEIYTEVVKVMIASRDFIKSSDSPYDKSIREILGRGVQLISGVYACTSWVLTVLYTTIACAFKAGSELVNVATYISTTPTFIKDTRFEKLYDAIFWGLTVNVANRARKRAQNTIISAVAMIVAGYYVYKLSKAALMKVVFVVQSVYDSNQAKYTAVIERLSQLCCSSRASEEDLEAVDEAEEDTGSTGVNGVVPVMALPHQQPIVNAFNYAMDAERFGLPPDHPFANRPLPLPRAWVRVLKEGVNPDTHLGIDESVTSPADYYAPNTNPAIGPDYGPPRFQVPESFDNIGDVFNRPLNDYEGSSLGELLDRSLRIFQPTVRFTMNQLRNLVNNNLYSWATGTGGLGGVVYKFKRIHSEQRPKLLAAAAGTVACSISLPTAPVLAGGTLVLGFYIIYSDEGNKLLRDTYREGQESTSIFWEVVHRVRVSLSESFRWLYGGFVPDKSDEWWATSFDPRVCSSAQLYQDVTMEAVCWRYRLNQSSIQRRVRQYNLIKNAELQKQVEKARADLLKARADQKKKKEDALSLYQQVIDATDPDTPVLDDVASGVEQQPTVNGTEWQIAATEYANRSTEVLAENSSSILTTFLTIGELNVVIQTVASGVNVPLAEDDALITSANIPLVTAPVIPTSSEWTTSTTSNDIASNSESSNYIAPIATVPGAPGGDDPIGNIGLGGNKDDNEGWLWSIWETIKGFLLYLRDQGFKLADKFSKTAKLLLTTCAEYMKILQDLAKVYNIPGLVALIDKLRNGLSENADLLTVLLNKARDAETFASGLLYFIQFTSVCGLQFRTVLSLVVGGIYGVFNQGRSLSTIGSLFVDSSAYEAIAVALDAFIVNPIFSYNFLQPTVNAITSVWTILPHSTERQSHVISVLRRAVTACRGIGRSGAAGADDFRNGSDYTSTQDSSSSSDSDEDDEKKRKKPKDKKKKNTSQEEEANRTSRTYFTKDPSAEFNNSLLWQTMLYVSQAS